MQIIRTISGRSETPCAVALGYFNGVHRGHRSVILAAVCAARRLSAAACVFTFDTQRQDAPRAKQGKPLLMLESQKFSALETLGVQTVLTPHFTEFCGLSPERFFREVLVDGLRAKAVCCGADYRFGAGAAGDTWLLRDLCRDAGVELVIVPPELYRQEVISSTRIIEALERGDSTAAADMAGRRIALEGVAQADAAIRPQADCCCGCGDAAAHPAAEDPALREQLEALFRNKAIAAFRTVYLDAPARFVRPESGVYRAVANGLPAAAALYPCGETLRWEACFEQAAQAAGKPLTLELGELYKPMRGYDSPETLRAAMFSMTHLPLPFLEANGR